MSINESGRMIYYIEMLVELKKKRSTSRHNTWVVSTYKTPSSIMLNDPDSMERLRRRLYNGKTEVKVIIKEINKITPLSKTARP